MERVRYIGDDPARDLAMSGGTVRCERMKWVDLAKSAEDARISSHHVPIVQEGLRGSPDWEFEGPVKAARTRKHNAETPATPDEEQS